MVSEVRFLSAGFCTHQQKAVYRAGKWIKKRFPSVATLIVHEKEGPVLFDTGYARRLLDETHTFPERLYEMMTPVQVEQQEEAASQLKAMGIQPQEIKNIVISHFHADHVAGLKDFGNSRFHFHPAGYRDIQARGRFSGVSAGLLKGLLPQDFEARSLALEDRSGFAEIPELGKGWMGRPLFKDESILVVPLPGHAAGHLGLFVRPRSGKPKFLLGDAVWVKESLETGVGPIPLVRLLFDSWSEYQKTLRRLHESYLEASGQVEFIPCHCERTYEELA